MRIKKILAMMLVICMIIGLFPVFPEKVEAAESTNETGDLVLDKTAVLEEDGTYTVRLEAYATGTPVRTQIKQGIPLQIVMVIDQSGSMVNNNYLEKVELAIEEFVGIIAANGRSFNVEHKIAIVGFASDEDDGTTNADTSQYPIAGGSTSKWINTGLFDSTGNFKNYSSGTETYTRYDGEISMDDSYYVKLGNGSYSEIQYRVDFYNSVENPSTDRTDLYALIGSEYKQVSFLENVRVETEPTDKNGIYFVDVDGEKTQLSYIEVVTNEGGYVEQSSIQQSQSPYYIYKDNVWVKLTPKNKNFWDGSDGESKYIVSNNKFEKNGVTYTPYKYQDTITEKGWSIDGTTILDLTNYQVYSEVSSWTYMDGNNSIVITPNVLYEYAHQSTWAYKDANGDWIALSNETIYTRTGGVLEGADYRDALVPITNGENGQGEIRESVTKAIHSVGGNGATRASYGMEMAKNIFEYNHHAESGEHGHVVVVFTDGAPGFSSYEESEANASLKNAEVLKADYDSSIYTVGLYKPSEETTDIKNFMNGLSSNYNGVETIAQVKSSEPVSDKYYQTTEYVSELNSVFTNITIDSTTTSTTVELDETAIMRDILGTGMELMPDSTVTATKVPGTKASDDANIVWEPNHAEVIGSITLDPNKPISEFTNDEESNVKLYNLSPYTMSDSGEYHPHTIDVVGFDYCGDFISVGKDGYKLVVEITGIEASPLAVWNQIMYTNNDYSGIWSPRTETQERELKASFAQPTTILTSTNYVVDYGKMFEVDLANDLGMSTVHHLDADDTNCFDSTKPVHSVQGTYGRAAIEGNRLTYTPMTMNWEYEENNPNKRGYETIYAFGDTTDDHVLANTANAAKGHLWSRFNVIPANNVYYEDDFITTSIDGTTQTGTVGIEYSGVWQNVGTTSGNNANENGGTHGWIEALSTEKGYSDGSAHVSNTSGARATFTFTGTGVDVYSRTDKSTGLVIGMLYKGDSIQDENGKNKVAEQMIWMDTLSESSGDGAYYQIPTMSFCDLEYGTYTVMLTVAKDLIKDDDERMTYYLDGIRVYNPLKNRENFDSTITDAYGKSEINASFKEVRDCLLENGSYGDEVSGAVFIDKFGDKVGYTESQLVSDFETFGPKNEVYLGDGQLIAFVVSYDPGAHYYVGMKSISGDTIKATYQYQKSKKQIEIQHTADLYYEVTPEWKDTNNDGVYDKGIISIANSGAEGVLGISKLKITNPMPEAVEITMFSRMSRAALVSYASALNMNVLVEDETEIEIEDSKDKVENIDSQEIPIDNLGSISKELFADMYSWF